MTEGRYPIANSILAIAGDDYVLIAIDVPLQSDQIKHARNQYMLFKITERTMLGSTMCWCEKHNVYNLLMARIKYYEQICTEPYPIECLAPIIARYSPRFLPNYRSNVSVGLDTSGQGAIYYNTAPNQYSRCRYYAAGLEGDYLRKVLYNRIDGVTNPPKAKLTQQVAVFFAVDTFRRILEGNELILIYVINASGMDKYQVPLNDS